MLRKDTTYTRVAPTSLLVYFYHGRGMSLTEYKLKVVFIFAYETNKRPSVL